MIRPAPIGGSAGIFEHDALRNDEVGAEASQKALYCIVE
jgi:hypothetical protein